MHSPPDTGLSGSLEDATGALLVGLLLCFGRKAMIGVGCGVHQGIAVSHGRNKVGRNNVAKDRRSAEVAEELGASLASGKPNDSSARGQEVADEIASDITTRPGDEDAVREIWGKRARGGRCTRLRIGRHDRILLR